MNGLKGKRMTTGAFGRCLGSCRALRLGAFAALFGFEFAQAGATSPQANPVSTPIAKYSAGTKLLSEGKLGEAETLLESAVGSQEERVQASALFNLGHVRFGQGIAELKKSPQPGASSARQKAAARGTEDAIKAADEALQSEDVDKMVAAYLRGKGAKREWKQATEAVKVAMDRYGTALAKWQRSLGDFKGAIELNPPSADAVRNAEVVDRCIAKLVDSIKEMQQCNGACKDKSGELASKMKQLKGKIPAPKMPPGAAGEDDEEEDQPMGKDPQRKEGPSREGQEMALSPEQAGWLLQGFKLDSDRRLPMAQGQQAPPKDRNRPTW